MSIEEQANDVVVAIAKARDDIVISAINERIGTGWSIESLADRLVRKVFQDRTEIFELDGVDIILLYPMKIDRVGTMLSLVQNYKILT